MLSRNFIAFSTFAIVRSGVGGSSLGCDDRTMIECAHRAQQDACVVACKGAGLILFSMFALEGFHIAEKMQVVLSERRLNWPGFKT